MRSHFFFNSYYVYIKIFILNFVNNLDLINILKRNKKNFTNILMIFIEIDFLRKHCDIKF